MDYDETLKVIHSFKRFGVQLGLERIEKLLKLMGNPQDSIKFIHVAGTNGKGSICTVISSVMRECGYKTGLYTSPAVEDFRERIQVNGQMIKKEALIKITEKIVNILEENKSLVITEFELVTAIAFEYFKEKKCDVVVLETGMGGRFDATNVIKSPILSVITSISFDHVQILGKTLDTIAFEKSGIIKEDCPVVMYPQQDNSVIKVIKRKACLMGSQIFVADRADVRETYFDLFYGTKFFYNSTEFKTSFVGEHQLNNLSTALLALKIVDKKLSISKNGLLDGIRKARIPARLEVLSREPDIILDGAHNFSGINALYSVLASYTSKKNLIGIVGMLRDKDVEVSFAKILPVFKRVTIVSPDSERALDVNSAYNIAKKYNKNVISESILEKALNLEITQLCDNDLLVIFGSLYLASDVKKLFKKVYYKIG